MIKGQMPVLISIKENRGLDLLLALITERVTTRFSSMVTPAITRIRHRKALEEAGRHLTHFTEIGALELQCEELRRAARAIGSITGHIDVEQVLDDIFFHFCIGK